jgi:predicted kinase
VGIADTPDWTTEGVDSARAGDVRLADAKLRQRLDSLSDAHPSGRGYSDNVAELPDPEDAADVKHAEHVAYVREALAEAEDAGLTTDRLYTVDDRRAVWRSERVALQEKVVNDLYAQYGDAPCEGKAIIAGGLPGSGKTTVLRERADIDLSRYLMINPDDAKEALAQHGMVPSVEGLTPMEASHLVHEESSLIAKRLAFRAYAEGKNVIWDITMSSTDSTRSRITDLRAAGYTDIEVVFVDIPVEVSVARAAARHREGHDDYLAGLNWGERYVAPEAIRAQADPEFGSANRRSFEQIKPDVDRWRLYDNSVDNRPAELVDQGESGDDEMRRRQ